MASTDVTGYNPAQVESLGTDIVSSSQKVADTIVEKLESGVIRPISEEWFAQEAKEFFDAFAETVRSTGQAIAEAFDSFISSVESAGNNWAENTKGTTVSLERVGSIDLNLDVSAIQTQDGSGNIGIKEEGARGVADSLTSVREEIQTTLTEEANRLNAETAFLGHDQAQAVTHCFEQVNIAVSKIFNFLIEGDNNLQAQINNAVQKYGEIGTETASAFNNASAE